MGIALLKGNPNVFGELANRAYGKITQALEVAGPDGGPVEYRDLTEQQLNERIRQAQDELDDDLGTGALEERIRNLQERLSLRRMNTDETKAMPNAKSEE